ncbi:hypothetical protein BDQ12DRAFT_609724 [Crucibulum laeve]|uniref:Histone-lysine N-methyltransferase SET5 n=1 Tax=Crucibulum laeve TaxID=68775 RepID=A0A5C3LXC0_9AGAR|nr:hypothetical protein BDQ12DRAFT_609724 [Crucibulum laeve]
MPISPSEDELKSSIIELKTKNSSLGIAKIHALVLSSNPEWTVSEKRTRKVLQNEGLIAYNTSVQDQVAVYPSSRVIPNLDVRKWTSKVEVKFFDKKKGKGLVAAVNIEEGETIWKEDPFIVAPEWDIFDLQMSSKACGYCTTPLEDSNLITTCSASSTSAYCPARFCNRLCQSRSAKTHTLLCPAQNPASIPLLKWARSTQWMAIHALTQCTSRILLAAQQDDATLEADWQVLRGFAELGMEERHKYSFKLAGRSEPDRAAWKKAHQLLIQAFKEPKTVVEQKKLARILKKPIKPEMDKELFDYDAGFLRGLGRMSLNLEAHGGLYTLHSHLNHSCNPNVSVRHFDKRNALSRITLVAKRPIKAREELLVTYVNPQASYQQRQSELQAWGFGSCRCERCVEEAKTVKELGPDDSAMGDLADELKAGLGVM